MDWPSNTTGVAAAMMHDRAVIASLPVSVQPGVMSGIFAAVDGLPGWGKRVNEALDAGARGILVVEPSHDAEFDLDRLSQRADDRRVPVVVYTRWADNPTVVSAVDWFREYASKGNLLETGIIVHPRWPLDAMLRAQLALVRAVADDVDVIEPIFVDDHGYSLLGKLSSGARVTLTATRTSTLPETASIRLLASTGSAQLEIPGQATAGPGTAVFTDASGATQLPTIFETAHRAAWRRLHAQVLHAQPGNDLAHFSHDVAVAARAFQSGMITRRG